MKSIICKVLCVTVCFLLISCAKEETQNAKIQELKEQMDKIQQRVEQIEEWQERISGKKIGDLVWSHQAPQKMNWEKAKNYCDNLNEKGFIDWHLPTISELRTLIQNCPENETGGSCGVIDTCLSKTCWSSDTCAFCPRDETGKYSKFKITNLMQPFTFWSSSSLADSTDTAWAVHFLNGLIAGSNKTENNYVRCVR